MSLHEVFLFASGAALMGLLLSYLDFRKAFRLGNKKRKIIESFLMEFLHLASAVLLGLYKWSSLWAFAFWLILLFLMAIYELVLNLSVKLAKTPHSGDSDKK